MKTRVPKTNRKKEKRYRFVTCVTVHAMCRGRSNESKIVSEDWLAAAILAAEQDPDIKEFFYEEVR